VFIESPRQVFQVSNSSSRRRKIVLDGIDVITFPERDDIHASLAPLHDFWSTECGGSVPIPRNLIDPVRLPTKILPRFAIIDIVRDPMDFRYRLLGTQLTQFFGRDSTGKRFSEVDYPQPQGDRLKRYFELVANDNFVVYRETTADWANRDYMGIASMFFPGTSNGDDTDLIVGAVITIK
jgi:hypothetical protein